MKYFTAEVEAALLMRRAYDVGTLVLDAASLSQLVQRSCLRKSTSNSVANVLPQLRAVDAKQGVDTLDSQKADAVVELRGAQRDIPAMQPAGPISLGAMRAPDA